MTSDWWQNRKQPWDTTTAKKQIRAEAETRKPIWKTINTTATRGEEVGRLPAQKYRRIMDLSRKAELSIIIQKS